MVEFVIRCNNLGLNNSMKMIGLPQKCQVGNKSLVSVHSGADPYSCRIEGEVVGRINLEDVELKSGRQT